MVGKDTIQALLDACEKNHTEALGRLVKLVEKIEVLSSISKTAKCLCDHFRMHLADEKTPLDELISDSEAAEEFLMTQKSLQEKDHEIQELKAKVNRNSRNSSKPPSSDGLKKPSVHNEDMTSAESVKGRKTNSIRKKSDRKKGGQPGHDGHGMGIPEGAVVLNDIRHIPEKCRNCSRCAECEKLRGKQRMIQSCSVVDLQHTITVQKHILESRRCPCCDNKLLVADAISDYQGTKQYGNGIRSLAVCLNMYGMMSVDRVHTVIETVFGLSVSTGTIENYIRKTAEKVQTVNGLILLYLLEEGLVHFDETGLRVAGSLHWLHSISTEKFTFLSLHKKRGKDAMLDQGFISRYTGIGIHDCWKSYWTVGTKMTHGLCWVHIIRELVNLIDNYKDLAGSWAGELQDLLFNLNDLRNKLIASGAKELDHMTRQTFLEHYDRILRSGLELNPIPKRTPGKRGRIKKNTAANLLLRLQENRTSFVLLLENLSVPFSNNIAEASIRMSKVRLKVSGCFRTLSGGRDFADIMTYLETARKNGVGAYQAILGVFEQKSVELIFGSQNGSVKQAA